MGDVKFEAGQVWEWVYGLLHGERRILTRYDAFQWHGLRVDRWTEIPLGEEPVLRERMRIVAPAPKPGQRWLNPTRPEAKIVDIGRDEISVEPVSPGDIDTREWCFGSVVTVAKWLLEKGYGPSPLALERPTDPPATQKSASPTVGEVVLGRFQIPPRLQLSPSALDGIRLLSDFVEQKRITKDPLFLLACLGRTIEQGVTEHARVRTESRRRIDEAVGQLRGEPFAKAIQAVLVGASEAHDLTQQNIAGMIAACRAWERRREQIAPGRRRLHPEHMIECEKAAVDVAIGAGSFWLVNAGAVYEAARAIC